MNIKISLLEDNTLKSFYEEETGEHIISGIGKLQLEVLINKIIRDNNIKLQIKPPEVVYRETITDISPIYDDVSSNRHKPLIHVVDEGINLKFLYLD